MITDSAIAAELRRIADANQGELSPHHVVDAARDEESPLHASFEWDDSEAAQQWRLQQARNLIRVVVSYEPVGDGKEIPVRVFVSLTPDRAKGGAGYRLTSAVMADEDQRRQLLLDARSEMKRFIAKYKALEELGKVLDAMRDATEIAQPLEDLRATA